MAEQRTLDAERAAFDKLLAAAQVVVNEGLDAAEERAHPCDVNDDEAKARLMPAPLQALYYAVQAARRAPPALDAEGLSPSWGVVETVSDMVRNLLTLDQAAPIYAAFHVDIAGERRCRTKPVTISRERVIDGKWVDVRRKDVPYAIIVWAKPDEHQSAPEGAPVGMEAVAWLEAEASARGQSARAVLNSFCYSTRMHTKTAPVTSNPVWALYAPTSASAQPADQNKMENNDE